MPVSSTITLVDGGACATFTLTATTTPSIGDLTGSIFAVTSNAPAAELPETPLAAMLPTTAAALIAGVVLFQRRRARRHSIRG
jgi:hypothetical protein